MHAFYVTSLKYQQADVERRKTKITKTVAESIQACQNALNLCQSPKASDEMLGFKVWSSHRTNNFLSVRKINF